MPSISFIFVITTLFVNIITSPIITGCLCSPLRGYEAKNSLFYDNHKNEKKRMVLGIKPGTSAPKKKKKHVCKTKSLVAAVKLCSNF